MSLILNFKKFMEEYWKVKGTHEKDFCYKCGSKHIHHFYEGVVEYDENKDIVNVKHVELCPFEGWECQECNHRWGDF